MKATLTYRVLLPHGLPAAAPLDQPRAPCARGVAIEAPTRSHPALTGASSGTLDHEWLWNLDGLEARLDVQSVHVAYLYGDMSDAVAARAAGALEAWGSAAFTCRSAWCRSRRSIRPRLLRGWFPRPVTAR